jgi:hypothetical protein
MSGIARLLAKQLSSSLGITDNPKYNPMFKQTEDVLTDVADPSDPTVARFYSPLESAIDEAPIGKEGTRGENIEAFVRKRAPKVTQAEMEYRGLGLEPGELYSAEGAKEGLKGLDVKAVKKGSRYRNMQRQSSLQDKELDYTELGLDASEDLGYTTHFGPSNLAHTRYSLRDGDKGNYILIEELQSDPLQNVVEDLPTFKKKTRAQLDTSLEYNYGDIRWLINTDGSGFADRAVNKIKNYIEDVVIPTQLNNKITKEERKDIFKKAVKDMDVPEDLIFGDSGSISNVTFNILSKEFDDVPDETLGELTDSMHNRVGTYIANLGAVTTKKDLPIQSISDSIRMSLQAIISDAKSKGVNEIVLPPVEKLAERRFSKDEVASKVAKGSAFYNTYVAAYQKVLKQLKNELGNQVKVGKKPLNYYVYDDKSYKQSVETVQGTLLDISNLTIDPTNIKLRFNKGGLVERPTK